MAYALLAKEKTLSRKCGKYFTKRYKKTIVIHFGQFLHNQKRSSKNTPLEIKALHN